MDQKTILKTRHEEFVFPTSNPDEMAGRYLASDVFRSWTEDFIDEDTGETIKIERREFVMKKGTFLSPDNLSSLSFYLQTGDVKTVSVTNVQRTGSFMDSGSGSIWSITVGGGVITKKRKYILFARGVDQALQIARDYLEQTIHGGFSILAAKNYQSCIVVPDDNLKKCAVDAEGNVVKEESVQSPQWYTISVIYKTKDNLTNYSFLLKATSVDDARARINRHVSDKLKASLEVGEEMPVYDLTVIAGGISNVYDIIPKEFSEAYFKWEDAEAAMKNPDQMLKMLDRALDVADAPSDGNNVAI